MSTQVSSFNKYRTLNGDHWGAFASVLCAIHCAITPVLLIMAPHFGNLWSHPATHWGMALVVIPLALWMTWKNYQFHQRKWVLTTSVLGVLFILAGATAPYFEQSLAGLTWQLTESFTLNIGAGSELAADAACVDSCCPSMHVDASGGSSSLMIPLASILTTIGGISLIATHIGNLCSCKCCGSKT